MPKFIYCSDAFNPKGFKRVSDDAPVDIDPARFIGITATTKEGVAADIPHYLDENKITGEALYDGHYAAYRSSRR